MKDFFPLYLKRQQAMQLLDCSRKELEKIVKNNNVRTYKTIGNHNRYFRDDLSKYIINLTK